MNDADNHEDRGTLTGHDIEAELLPDWRFLLGALHARFKTGDFATGLKLVEGIGKAAEARNHHPDVDLRYPQVDVRLTSHDVGGVTQRDIELAREITDLAGRVGAEPDAGSVQALELGLDTPDSPAVRDFWAALLGSTADHERDEVVDPDGRLPSIWFQKSDDRRGGDPQQRWHLDVWVPLDHAERRVQEALAAGGTLVSDARAPSFWVLADAQGNQACVCTWVGHGPTPEVTDSAESTDSESVNPESETSESADGADHESQS